MVADPTEVACFCTRIVERVVAKIAAILPRIRIGQIMPGPESTGLVAITERLARGCTDSFAGEMTV